MVRTAKAPAKKTTVSKAQAKEPQEAQRPRLRRGRMRLRRQRRRRRKLTTSHARGPLPSLSRRRVAPVVAPPPRIDAAALVYDEGASSWDGGHSRDCESHIAVSTRWHRHG